MLATQSPVAAQAQDHAHHRRRRAGRRRHRQGRGPGHHRADRRRRRERPRHRIRRQRHPRPLDGRPPHPLQHVDRGRRPRRHGRARRHHLRLPRRAGPSRRRARSGTRPLARWRALPSDAGAALRPRGRARRGRHRADGHLGHQPGGRAPHHRPRAEPATRAGRRSGARHERALDYMGLARARRSTRCRSTASSSAPAPTAASRTCAPPPPSPRAARSRSVRAWVVPGSGLVKRAGRGRGARPGLPRRRLRVARAGLLDVHRHERRHRRPGAALRLHLQPQLRRPAGAGRADAPREPGHGRRRRRDRPLHRRAPPAAARGA